MSIWETLLELRGGQATTAITIIGSCRSLIDALFNKDDGTEFCQCTKFFLSRALATSVGVIQAAITKILETLTLGGLQFVLNSSQIQIHIQTQAGVYDI